MGAQQVSANNAGDRSDNLEAVLEAAQDLVGHLELTLVFERSLKALSRLVELESVRVLLMEKGSLVEAASDGSWDDGSWDGDAEPSHLIEEPLIARGEVLGVLQLRTIRADAKERELLRTFLPFMSSAIANATEFEEQRLIATRSEELQRVQKEFLSVVSHELRTPLAVVMGYAETLAKNVELLDAEQVVNISSRTRDAGRRLARLIGDLFDLAQADRGSLRVSLYPTSVERVLEQASFEARSTKHELQVLCDPDLPPVLADRDRLNQVVLNLVSNAERYSPEGTTVRVVARHEEGEVAITVEDEGIGISPEMRSRIFERFFRAEDPQKRTVGGLGVGLFLVKEMCDRMNATIEVDSTPGRGSRFTVKLPVAAPLAS
jgi:signal transduction histidine kinase